MVKNVSFQVSLITLASLCATVQNESEFTYSGNMGPDHWSEYFNKCSGKHQSPININDVDVINRTYADIIYKDFDKLPLGGVVFNNGHTVLVKMTYADEVPSIASGPLMETNTYQLQQLHFHWGEDDTRGSEDRINDMAYPMELHVVFRNSKYDSFQEAAREDDGIAVLAAFYKVGNCTSMEYDHLTSHLPSIQEPHSNASLSQSMNLFSLLPDDLRKYYTYTGSLTTPPCNEDVIWIDYVNPIAISAEMVERFRYLKTFGGSLLTHNFRPLQPLNNRNVYRAVFETSEKKLDNSKTSATPINSLHSSATVSSFCVSIALTIILGMNWSYYTL